nr:MAG TPA: hypothetical protein [Caudoviricetes sp.]
MLLYHINFILSTIFLKIFFIFILSYIFCFVKRKILSPFSLYIVLY